MVLSYLLTNVGIGLRENLLPFRFLCCWISIAYPGRQYIIGVETGWLGNLVGAPAEEEGKERNRERNNKDNVYKAPYILQSVLMTWQFVLNFTLYT